MSKREVLLSALCAAAVSASASASAGNAPPDHGLQFVTIGDPGNANYVGPAPTHPGDVVHVGGVDYEYRIATHEVSVGQWFRFLQAYAPFVQAEGTSGNSLAGERNGIGFFGFNSQGVAQFSLDARYADQPAFVSWRNGARFTNWLHNGAPDAATATAADFMTGAYDTSTFGQTVGPTGSIIFTDQRTRSEGAQYWIPGMHEWVKAAHYDPNRHGEGEGGYWLYPDTSDTALTPGDPAEGGETNLGSVYTHGRLSGFDEVGSYPDVQSPWGLLDVSGGGSELTETDIFGSRVVLGSSIYEFVNRPDLLDIIGFWRSVSPDQLEYTLRVASAVPAPGTGVVIVAAGALLARRRSR